jgi:hypothetical protein
MAAINAGTGVVPGAPGWVIAWLGSCIGDGVPEGLLVGLPAGPVGPVVEGSPVVMAGSGAASCAPALVSAAVPCDAPLPSRPGCVALPGEALGAATGSPVLGGAGARAVVAGPAGRGAMTGGPRTAGARARRTAIGLAGVAATGGSVGPAERGSMAAAGLDGLVAMGGSAGSAERGSAVATARPDGPGAMTAPPWIGSPTPTAVLATLTGLPMTAGPLGLDVRGFSVAARRLAVAAGRAAAEACGLTIGAARSAWSAPGAAPGAAPRAAPGAAASPCALCAARIVAKPLGDVTTTPPMAPVLGAGVGVIGSNRVIGLADTDATSTPCAASGGPFGEVAQFHRYRADRLLHAAGNAGPYLPAGDWRPAADPPESWEFRASWDGTFPATPRAERCLLRASSVPHFVRPTLCRSFACLCSAP